jgi:YHS domain-containing protein
MIETPEKLQNVKALKGYDPVSYFGGMPVRGIAHVTHSYDNTTYNFVNDKNLEAFASNPEKYAPLFGGWCAKAMAENKIVDSDPETFKIQNGKLLVFYNGPYGNTLEQWEETDTDESFAKASTNWDNLRGEK